jgi:uncharacterized protein (TIGR00156 family)
MFLAFAAALAAALALFPPPAPLHAEGGAPGATPPEKRFKPSSPGGAAPDAVTVADALKAGDGADVALKGSIVRPLGDGKYLFKDDTGETAIDVAVIFMRPPDPHWPRAGAEIMIFGEVDKEPNGDVEINVTKTAPPE